MTRDGSHGGTKAQRWNRMRRGPSALKVWRVSLCVLRGLLFRKPVGAPAPCIEPTVSATRGGKGSEQKNAKVAKVVTRFIVTVCVRILMRCGSHHLAIAEAMRRR